MRQQLLLVLLSLATLPAIAASITKWVDENGVVHFGDAPPPRAKHRESVRIKTDDLTISNSGNDQLGKINHRLKKIDYEHERRLILRELSGINVGFDQSLTKRANNIKRKRFLEAELKRIDRDWKDYSDPAGASARAARRQEQERVDELKKMNKRIKRMERKIDRNENKRKADERKRRYEDRDVNIYVR